MKNEDRVSATRARLIEAAIAALADIGYHRTTFVEVSRRSNLSRGAIHHHFESIPALMGAVAQDIAEGLRGKVVEKLEHMPSEADIYDASIDYMWDEMNQPPYLALLQIRAALATDEDLRKVVNNEVTDLVEWLQSQASSTILAKTNGPVPDRTLVRVLISSLAGASAADAAIGAPAEDPNRAVYLSTLKKMVKTFNAAAKVEAEKGAVAITAKPEEIEAVI